MLLILTLVFGSTASAEKRANYSPFAGRYTCFGNMLENPDGPDSIYAELDDYQIIVNKKGKVSISLYGRDVTESGITKIETEFADSKQSNLTNYGYNSTTKKHRARSAVKLLNGALVFKIKAIGFAAHSVVYKSLSGSIKYGNLSGSILCDPISKLG